MATTYTLVVVIDDCLQRLSFETEELARSAQSIFGGTVKKVEKPDNRKETEK